MKHQILAWWGQTPSEIKYKGAVIILVLITILIFAIRSKLKKVKLEAFLFNNNYHSVKPRTNEIIFPTAYFRKNKIILKSCIRKTLEQIREEKSLWEQAFYRELKGRKISDIKSDGSKIIMALV